MLPPTAPLTSWMIRLMIVAFMASPQCPIACVGLLVGQQATTGYLLGYRSTATGTARAHSPRSATPAMSRGPIPSAVTCLGHAETREPRSAPNSR